MATPIIEVQNLTYFYPGKKALDDVSFSIERGSITALVGPNGAGKTTLLRTLAGLELPFSGKIDVAGLDVLKDPRLAHTKMGFLSDDFGLYNDLTVDDVLEFIGGCHNLAGEALKTRISWAVDLMNLGSVRKQKCGTLSRGWRQRTGIGLAILNRPEVLILDEPASGLDPEARFELSGIMRSLQSIGITSLVSSHILSELEEYCTAMLVLRDGRVLQNVSLETQREKANAVIVIAFARPVTAEQESVISTATGQKVTMLNSLRTSVRINASNDPEQHHSILKLLVAKELPVCGFTLEGESLQSLYLEMSETSNRGSR